MLQVVLNQPRKFVRAEVPAPCADAGCAVVRIERIGVCGTDLHAFAGRQPFFEYPRILGHELAGVIEELPGEWLPRAERQSSGKDSNVVIQDTLGSARRGYNVGDRVAIEPYVRCGRCSTCRAGRYNCCEQLACLGVHIDGGMRERLAVPMHLLHKSEKLPLDQLALVETLGIGAHAVTRSNLAAGETALVVGAGPIGLATLVFAQLTGATVRLLELNDRRRKFAARMGVETLSAPDDHLADVVFDATGNAAAMAASLKYVAFGGRLVFVGLTRENVVIDDPLFHRREVTLLASRNSCHEFPRIISLMEQGRIDVTPWITHRLNLKDVPERFVGLYDEPDLVKAMIDVGTQEE